MSPVAKISNETSAASSWSMGAASLGFWEAFSSCLLKQSKMQLGYDDLPVVDIEASGLDPGQARWTTFRPVLSARCGCLKFEASLEMPAASVLFSFHAVGITQHIATDPYLLQFGAVRWRETPTGFGVETLPKINLVETEVPELAYKDFCKRADALADWVFERLVNQPFELFKNIPGVRV